MRRRFAVELLGAVALVCALSCGVSTASAQKATEVVASLSIDLNDDGWKESITVFKVKEGLVLSVKLVRGTKNGDVVDVTESLGFQWLTELAVLPIIGPDESPAVVLTGLAGMHCSEMIAYSIGKGKRFTKVLDVSGDGGVGLSDPPEGGTYVWVRQRTYDTLQRCVTYRYQWDGSKFVGTDREVGYYFDHEFIYPQEPETVAAAYVEAAVLNVPEELQAYIAKDAATTERLRLERLGESLRSHFGDFTSLLVLSAQKVPGQGRGDSYELELVFHYRGNSPSREAILRVQLVQSADGRWRVTGVEIVG